LWRFAQVLSRIVRYCIQPQEQGETAGELFSVDGFDQRILRFEAPSDARSDADRDEVLYVLRGHGSATIGGDRAALEPGTAAYVPRGTPWSVDATDGLELLSVLVHDPSAADGHAVIEVDAQDAGAATAGRMFRLLACPDVGCASVTQFVGYIPVVRAPDHFHRYDEVVYVMEGEGLLHVDGESAPVRAGTAIHFPAGLVHCLENTGPGEMQVLGVFRPAGSPAEAYYPDGRKAEY
jgi:mannose-6-phosphate isomerase-like protein (cupin superfamily)